MLGRLGSLTLGPWYCSVYVRFAQPHLQPLGRDPGPNIYYWPRWTAYPISRKVACQNLEFGISSLLADSELLSNLPCNEQRPNESRGK